MKRQKRRLGTLPRRAPKKRKLTKNLELSYKNEIFQIKCATSGYTMRQATVTVCESPDGTITLIYKGRTLTYTRHKKNL